MALIGPLRGPPKRIQVDNGSQFISKALDKWAHEHGVQLDFSQPGKPTDNPFIESVNNSFRDEWLIVHWFLRLADAQEKIEHWRIETNEDRTPQLARERDAPRVLSESLIDLIFPGLTARLSGRDSTPLVVIFPGVWQTGEIVAQFSSIALNLG